MRYTLLLLLVALLNLSGHYAYQTTNENSPSRPELVLSAATEAISLGNKATNATVPELIIWRGHTGYVSNAIISPDNSQILTTDSDGSAIIWNALSGNQVKRLDGPKGYIESAEYNDEGSKIITLTQSFLPTSSKSVVTVWDAISGKKETTYNSNGLKFVQLSPNGKYFLTGNGSPGGITVYNTLKGDHIRTFTQADSNAGKYRTSVIARFSPDSKHIAYIREKGQGIVHVRDIETGDPILELNHNREISEIQYSKNGKYILTISWEQSKLWNSATGECIYSTSGWASFDNQGDAIAVNQRGRILVLEINLPGDFITITPHNYSGIHSVKFTSDKKYIITFSDQAQDVWSRQSGKLIRSIPYPQSDTRTKEVNFSKDGQFFLTADRRITTRKIDLYESYYGSPVTCIYLRQSDIEVKYSPDHKKMCASDPPYLAMFDLELGDKIWEINTNELNEYIFSPNSKYLLEYSLSAGSYDGKDNFISIRDIQTGQMLHLIMEPKGSGDVIRNPSFNKEGTQLLYTTNKSIYIINSANWTLIKKLTLPIDKYPTEATNNYQINYASYISDDQKIISYTNGKHDSRIQVWNIDSGIIETEIKELDVIRSIQITEQENSVTTHTDWSIRKWDLSTGKLIIHTDAQAFGSQFPIRLSPLGKYVTTRVNDSVSVFDLSSKQKLLTLYASIFTKISFLQSETALSLYYPEFDSTAIVEIRTGHVITENKEEYKKFSQTPDLFDSVSDFAVYRDGSSFRIYRYSQKKEVYQLSILEDLNFVVVLPSGFYRASAGARQFLNWKYQDQLYDFDQWDLQFNRPDKVLIGLGCKDSSMIKLHHEAYLKRLKKLNIDTSRASFDYRIPEVQFETRSVINTITQDSIIELDIKASDKDTKNWISKIHVTINGVELFGIKGIDVGSRKLREINLRLPLELSKGYNIIKVYSVNNKSAESVKKTCYLIYEPRNSRDCKTYFIGIGISKYLDSTFNLTYAAKDAQDLATAFTQKNPNTEVHLLLDEKATRENIRALKQNILGNTKVDDIVIVSFSGHGVVDKKRDFFFATHNIDFKDPAQEGLAYDDIEWLLDSIPARKKLVLIDACHSGELDKDQLLNTQQFNEHPADTNVRSLPGSKGVKQDKDPPFYGLNNSFDLMLHSFANISRNNGATIISAAAGTEFAYEGRGWNNGVFTYSILSGLMEMQADTDKSGAITVGELKTFVSNKVFRLTNGLQRPTARQENLEFDWVLW